MNVDIKTRQEEVQKELNNILNSPSFKKSPRSSELLSYLVNHKLNKGGSPLKGEIISQDVFGRTSQNDADDTIVRVSASRLRKMLKAYYHRDFAHRMV